MLDPSEELRVFGAEALEAGRGVTALFSGFADDWCLRRFPADNRKGQWCPQKAGHWIIAGCNAKGVFDLNSSNLRSSGVWRDDAGQAIAHCGDCIITGDGQTVPLSHYDTKHTWLGSQKVSRPDLSGMAQDDVKALWHQIDSAWGWKQKQDSVLLLGWIGMATLGGFPTWRSHLYISGSRGTGKSELRETCSKVLGDLAGGVLNDVTEAGLRQTRDNQARPLLLDEFEPDAKAIEARRQTVSAVSKAERMRIAKTSDQGWRSPMTKDWVSSCVGRAIKGLKATVLHELGCPLPPLQLEHYQSYVQEPHSGGLGWGLPAAIGAQLADPDRLIFATMGDGSYMFANPTACHQICEALNLPVITLVLNNEEWGAVRRSVAGLYKGGLASKSNDVPLTSLRPSPDFTKTAEASRAYTETVVDGAELPAALARAINVASLERRQVLLNIAIEREGSH